MDGWIVLIKFWSYICLLRESSGILSMFYFYVLSVFGLPNSSRMFVWEETVEYKDFCQSAVIIPLAVINLKVILCGYIFSKEWIYWL